MTHAIPRDTRSAVTPMEVAPRLAAAIPQAFPGTSVRLTGARDALELTMHSPSGPTRVYVPVALDPGPDGSSRAQRAMEARLAELALIARMR